MTKTAFDDITAVSTTTSSVSLGNLILTPAFKTLEDADLSTISGIQLSNASGKMGAWTGAIAATKDADENCYKVFKVVVTATLDSAAEAAGYSVQTAKKELIDDSKGGPHTVAVTPAGNALVKKLASSTAGSSELTTLYGLALKTADENFTITFADDATDSWTAYYAVAVRTNNLSGKEYVKSGDANATYAQVVPEESSATDSDLVCYKTGTYRLETRADKDSDWGNRDPESYLHDANNLHVAIS